jgi:thiol-disulfide isomerase/thioredoxin
MPSGAGSGPARLSETKEEARPVELQVVKLDQLKKALAAQSGKVVVLDFWADYCVPCKEEFPHLVEMHRKHAAEGVVCMSVSLDPATEKANALKFLQKQKAAFPNYLLDEGPEVCQNEWEFKAPPAVMVYGRDGKLARKFDSDDPNNQFTYADVEPFVRKLLAP